MSKQKRWSKTAAVIVISTSLLGGQLTPAYAAMTSTPSLVQQEQLRVDRSELLQALERESVREQLQAYGVDADAARERVAAMTEEEIRQLNAHLDEMPAGGDVLGIIVLVFIVLVITDMLGATDVFPFVHDINH